MRESNDKIRQDMIQYLIRGVQATAPLLSAETEKTSLGERANTLLAYSMALAQMVTSKESGEDEGETMVTGLLTLYDACGQADKAEKSHADDGAAPCFRAIIRTNTAIAKQMEKLAKNALEKRKAEMEGAEEK